MKINLLSPRLGLILSGIVLGLIARMVLGVPDETDDLSRTIERPPAAVSEEMEEINLPLSKPTDQSLKNEDPSGVIGPIVMPGAMDFADPNELFRPDDFAHDPDALFESHGEQLCASGCAASRHPTAKLTTERFQQLIEEYKIEPMDQTNNALEELLFYGPQSKKMIQTHGVGSLDKPRSKFLWDQLKCNRAKISLRIVDLDGDRRSWLDSTAVPFDRRHVFDMKTKNLQPLVTSGTVKRVGLNHMWVRL